MNEDVKLIIKCLESLIGKSISITWGNSNIRGVLISLKNYNYFYELILKINKTKKKFVLFYPFSAKKENGCILFDYRLKTLSKKVPKELLYNLIGDSSAHSFLDKIVHICE